MMDINYYIKTAYNDNPLWFMREVEKPHHINKISKCYALKRYLHGDHEVLGRKDITYKGQTFKVKKLILQIAKTIVNFHSTYLLGKSVSLTGCEELVKEFQSIYNYGSFNDVDLKLMTQNTKYGDAYEYIYRDDNGNITSKVFDSACSYPVFADDGTYVAFIEHWTNIEGISYWNVYYEDIVQEWTNEGADPYIKKVNGKDTVTYNNLTLIDEYDNESGLPNPYFEGSDWDYRYGEGLLELIIPVLDELEDLFSKMGDAIYTLSLNPLLTTIGQAIEGSISNDAVGYNINLDNGSDMKYVTANMDYNTIKVYIDKIENYLNMTAYLPSILGGSGNIANVSEVSLKMLYQLADVYAMITERIMRRGFNKRFNIIRKMIGRENKEEYINVEFNYARPQNATETLDNINKQVTMGAMSIESAIEKSPLTLDKTQELERLKKDKKENSNTKNVDTNNDIVK